MAHRGAVVREHRLRVRSLRIHPDRGDQHEFADPVRRNDLFGDGIREALLFASLKWLGARA
jgi:hypothetical protein